jgi:glycosyltransferase involved in cell wall biosynthesis
MISKMVDGGWNRDLFAHVPTFVHPAPGPTHGAKEDVPVIAYAGRLERTKGVETLLGAAGVLERDPSVGPFRILIAGDGEPSYVAGLQQLAADRRLDSPQFIGAQDSAGVATLLRRAWCSVVPSLWYENSPNAALESMAQATAVVAADHGSLPEIVRHGATGWLTPPGDSTELAGALRKMILRRDLVDRMGSAASDFVRREHSADTHYARLMDVFTSLTANSRGTF